MEGRFNCEVLTPLFLGGADPRAGSELRPPSVRGALRYWYRALVGGSSLMRPEHADETDDLRRREERVFGSPGRGSTVSVLVLAKGKPEVRKFERDRPVRTADGDVLSSGRDYLLWSMGQSGRPENPAGYRPRQYIVPGSEFEIILRTRFQEAELEEAGAALWLLANLGAIGARANRGAGSFWVRSTEGVTRVPAFEQSKSVEELAAYLARGIRQSLAVVAGPRAVWRKLDGPPDYDVLCPDAAEVWVVAGDRSGWASDVAALHGVGERLRDYRRDRSPVGRADHDAVLDWLRRGGEGPVIKRAAFGLPLPFRYSQGGPADVIQSTVGSRRASPLKIRITQLATGKYVGVITLFKSGFLPPGERLQLQKRKWKAPPPSDYRVVQEFIESFPVKRGVVYG